MPLSISKSPARVFGKVQVGCPVCGQKSQPLDVSLPPTDVGVRDLVLKRTVSIPDLESADQVRLFGELEMTCGKCKVPIVHYEPIAETTP